MARQTSQVLEIRRVHPDEWRELRELRLEALQDSPDAFWTRYEEAIERTDADWREWTTFPCHVAVEDGRLVGMVAAFADEEDAGTADLIAMFVTPDARGRGIGAALVDAQLAWARAEGFARMRLMVNVERGPAFRLYERCGFTDTGERTQLREGPHALATMVRDL
jgi:GNAT superfamily N-acetyltransferase